ncbi:MAG: nickel pincer cofactor biosynthesis protein LarC [Patescibacteria group bacterium]|nr:nickel pincer cofactor biosynthesis protein LarC [Patescibacteria group bacterium]
MTRIAYFDCASGISGDMTLGALVDAGADLDAMNRAIHSLGLPGCRLVAQEVKKHALRATQVTVEYTPEHKHRHLHHILAMLDAAELTGRQRQTARQIFTRLAEAEAKVHGCAIEKVHFHEVGAADSIADVVGAAVGLDLLGVDRVVASPVTTGHGRVRIAHGEVSIPAPATAELLCGIPVAESRIEGELTTPTGAAILATLAERFGPMPSMTIVRVGCGAGQMDLPEQANVLRLILGEVADADEEEVCMVETNLDDTSGEMIGHAVMRLWQTGALDVFTTAIQMKKNRPGATISVLCRTADAPAVEAVLFRETSTLGVRRWPVARQVLARREHRVATPWGDIEGKIAFPPGGPPRFSPEFESCRRVAVEHDVALPDVYDAALRAFDAKNS